MKNVFLFTRIEGRGGVESEETLVSTLELKRVTEILYQNKVKELLERVLREEGEEAYEDASQTIKEFEGIWQVNEHEWSFDTEEEVSYFVKQLNV